MGFGNDPNLGELLQILPFLPNFPPLSNFPQLPGLSPFPQLPPFLSGPPHFPFFPPFHHQPWNHHSNPQNPAVPPVGVPVSSNGSIPQAPGSSGLVTGPVGGQSVDPSVPLVPAINATEPVVEDPTASVPTVNATAPVDPTSEPAVVPAVVDVPAVNATAPVDSASATAIEPAESSTEQAADSSVDAPIAPADP